jgi:hypothetical protein
MKHIAIIFISLLAFFSSCRCHKNIISKKKYTLEESARLMFYDKYNIDFNKNSDFAIVSKSFKEITQPIPDLIFFIYSQNDKSTIFSDTLEAGDVYWANNYQVVANERTQKAESPRIQYIYDVNQKKIIKK